MRAIAYIESSLGDPIDLDSICRRAHLSKFYFSRIFQAMVGETVFDYVRKRRLAEIAQRLVSTSIPIADLALAFGYESQQSMTRAFLRQYHITPGKYRRGGTQRFFFHRPRLSQQTIVDLHRDISLKARVFRLPALRIVGLRDIMPITDPGPVEQTRARFTDAAADLARWRQHRGVFEVTLMDRDDLISYSPAEGFAGLIGYSVRPDARISDGFAEVRYPASRYLTFHFTGEASIRRLSSVYRYMFSAGIADRRERLADRDFFHYYRRVDTGMLFFLPLSDPA